MYIHSRCHIHAHTHNPSTHTCHTHSSTWHAGCWSARPCVRFHCMECHRARMQCHPRWQTSGARGAGRLPSLRFGPAAAFSDQRFSGVSRLILRSRRMRVRRELGGLLDWRYLLPFKVGLPLSQLCFLFPCRVGPQITRDCTGCRACSFRGKNTHSGRKFSTRGFPNSVSVGAHAIYKRHDSCV